MHWIALAITCVLVVIGWAVTWGRVFSRLHTAESAIKRLTDGREDQGKRIGIVEERVAYIEGRLDH